MDALTHLLKKYGLKRIPARSDSGTVLESSAAAVPDSNNPATSVIWVEGDGPLPVTEQPLGGLELTVLRVWKENSPNARSAYRQNSRHVEQAVRDSVYRALLEELRLRAQGMTPGQAQELTRPEMWKAPRFQR